MLVYFATGGEAHGSGGWAKYVRELNNYLVDRNCRVKILCRMGKMYTSVNENSTNFHFQTASTPHFRRGFSFYALMQHLPNPLSVIFGAIRLAKDIRSEGGCPKILHAHDLGSSLLIALLMKLFRLPFVVQVHGFPLKEQHIKLTRAKSPLSNFIWFLTKVWHNVAINFIRSSSAPVLVNNSEVKSFYESCGISSDKLKVISSAIDLQKHEEGLLSATDAETCLGIKGLRKWVTIGYVGGLRPEKNVATLIKAFRGLLENNSEARVRLVIIGDGPMRSLLEETVKRQDLSSYVLFLGFIPDAYRFLNIIDLFVLPSLSEGSPLSLIEAMATGKAIIASDIPSIREIVRHNKEAILVDPLDVEALKQAILLLHNNPDLRTKLGRRARERAKLYDVSKVYGQILNVYEELVRCKAKYDTAKKL